MRNVRSAACKGLALLLLLGLLTACDSGGDNGDDDGPDPGDLTQEFTLNVTGNGVDESFEGFSVWGEPDDGSGATAFVVVFSENSGSTMSGSSGFLYRQGDRPGTGSYAVADIDTETDALVDFAFYFLRTSGSSTFVNYYSSGGTIDITTSNDNTVAGEFNIPGTRIEPTGTGGVQEVDVTLSGSFSAARNPDVDF